MDQLPALDVPAWASYLLVIVVGLISACLQVNSLLATFPDRWGFFGTWSLVIAHWTVPVILFWFLDLTGALHDTSPFAAILVAVGYQQIFAGGVQGIKMPGETPKLWQPFEKWVSRVADGIATRQKRTRDDLKESLRRFVMADAGRMKILEATAMTCTSNPTDLQDRLNKIDSDATPTGADDSVWKTRQSLVRVDALLLDLQLARPEQYPRLLRDAGLFKVENALYWTWFHGLKGKIASVVGAVAVVGALIAACILFRQENLQRTYFRWRFTKSNGTTSDRFRTCEYVAGVLRDAKSKGKEAQDLMGPLLTRLRFVDVSPVLVDDLTRIVIDAHSVPADGLVIPVLIEDLRTPNANVRLALQRTLVALAAADFPGQDLDDATKKWVPTKEESPAQIDERVRTWKTWWGKQAVSEAHSQ